MEHILGVALVWLLAAAWIFLLVNWAITGEVSAAEAALGSTVALLLALASAQRAFPQVVPFSLATLGGGAVALPLLRAYLNRAAHAQMDAELIERACLAYEFDPKNYGALINLAEVCYKNGLLEQAVHHLERAIQQAPVMAANEKRRLRMWQDELQHHPKHGYTPCMHCGARSSVGAVRCERCRHLLLPLLVQGRWVPRQLVHKAVAVWGVAVGASALSLLWREQLTGLNALVAILATLSVALGLIVWVVRKS
jgi:tetratricopeptide (TPR) repeat protein